MGEGEVRVGQAESIHLDTFPLSSESDAYTPLPLTLLLPQPL